MGSFDFTLSWCTKNTAGLLPCRVFVYCKQYEMLISQEFVHGGVMSLWQANDCRSDAAMRTVK